MDRPLNAVWHCHAHPQGLAARCYETSPPNPHFHPDCDWYVPLAAVEAAITVIGPLTPEARQAVQILRGE